MVGRTHDVGNVCTVYMSTDQGRDTAQTSIRPAVDTTRVEFHFSWK